MLIAVTIFCGAALAALGIAGFGWSVAGAAAATALLTAAFMKGKQKQYGY